MVPWGRAARPGGDGESFGSFCWSRQGRRPREVAFQKSSVKGPLHWERVSHREGLEGGVLGVTWNVGRTGRRPGGYSRVSDRERRGGGEVRRCGGRQVVWA